MKEKLPKYLLIATLAVGILNALGLWLSFIEPGIVKIVDPLSFIIVIALLATAPIMVLLAIVSLMFWLIGMPDSRVYVASLLLNALGLTLWVLAGIFNVRT